MSPRSIAFIGTGVMGRSMAGHLLKAGHTLHLHNRTRAKAQSLLDVGAHWHDTAGAAAAQADFVFTIVGFPRDVEETYFGDDGVIDRARPGAVLVDMTTSSPKLAQRIAAAATAKGLAALDAPVTGGDVGAREARLSIMVGGDESAFNLVRPLFDLMGKGELRGIGREPRCQRKARASPGSQPASRRIRRRRSPGAENYPSLQYPAHPLLRAPARGV